MLISCNCGQVQMELSGKPIIASACHCDDCQAGWGNVEALENAPPVVDERGGIAYVFILKDRLTYLKGKELLQGYRLRPESPLQRVVASCCNSAMYAERDGHFWLAVIRDRFGSEAPPLEGYHYTKFSRQQPFVAPDLPSYPKASPRVALKVLLARLALVFGR